MEKWDIFAKNGEIEIERPFDFTKHSSIGCGGFASIGFFPKRVDSLRALLSALDDEGKPYVVLGNLTNVLPPSKGTEKAVVCTKKIKETTRFGERIRFSCGTTPKEILSLAHEAGLYGAEFLTGIPCTMGGAAYMNAGAGGRYLAEILESVEIYRKGRVIILPVSACGYSYKSSLFMQTDDVILGGVLRLKQGSAEFAKESERIWRERRAHLPKGKSMGCVFKNADGYCAGELIDKAGLKGLRVGGAVVSETHANFIINDKKATADEVLALITMVKNAVFAQYKINLQEEIRYLR